MLQANYKKEQIKTKQKFTKILQEGIFIFTLAIALFLFLSLVSYRSTDPCWSHTGAAANHINNIGGRAGAWLSDILLCAFGYVAYIFPLMLIYIAWKPFTHNASKSDLGQMLFILNGLGFFIVIISGSSLASIHLFDGSLPLGAGGILGDLFKSGMINIFNFIGTDLLLLALFLVGITLFSGISWPKFVIVIGRSVFGLIDFIGDQILQIINLQPKEIQIKKEPTIIKETPTIIKETPVIIKQPIQPTIKISLNIGGLPSLSLLDPAEKKANINYTNAELEEMSKNVELRLRDFGIDACVVAVHPGPVITRFEIQLAPGTKVNRITSLAKDLARSLSVISVRVVEVIPGKSVIGLELPNINRETVKLSEVLSSQQYERARSPLVLALGKDIAGHPVVVDLAKMPHLLVAGTTGSGKSVCLNALLLSILYKYTPKETRMILIDPKMLELSIYADIPHLLTPVVTDMKEAINVLRWCVAEMERRYKLMVTLGVRNIIGYNNKIRDAAAKGLPLINPLWQPNANDPTEKPEQLQELPYIVVIADEYADMIIVVGKKVEELISRIAQKARAAGIHLILATQRPSVDVITGLIKANIPTRIAFQVSSKIDSRTILDQSGAEQLLGCGDMLYLPPGSGIPVRVHGSFVTDGEVHRVVSDLKTRGKPEYMTSILDGSVEPIIGIDTEATIDQDAEQDPLYDQAVQIVLQSRRASISNIQRRLKIGYNRAARLIETMESAGIVSAMETNGSREVLAPHPPQTEEEGV